MEPYPFVPLEYERPDAAEQLEASRRFLARLQRRRTVRQFSTDPVPFEGCTVPDLKRKAIGEILIRQ